jgi:DNA-cytosine methyltransferase
VSEKSKQLKAAALREDSPPYHVKLNGSHNELRFIDLFCGIGGFRIAFEKTGCQCVFSSDWNKYAQQTYAANFGEQPHGDIHSVAVADIPAHDILCAGFPCQPFSIAGVSKKQSLGRATGFQDKEQGNLFFTLADIIDYHRPAAFVLENVKNLRNHDQGRTFGIIDDTLTKALGYTVYYKVIDAQSVEPQHRERIFLVGFKERRGFEFPEFPANRPKLETILEDNAPEKYTLTDHHWKISSRWKRRKSPSGSASFSGKRIGLPANGTKFCSSDGCGKKLCNRLLKITPSFSSSVISPASNAASCSVERQSPLRGFSRSAGNFPQGLMWLATSKRGTLMPLMQQRTS